MAIRNNTKTLSSGWQLFHTPITSTQTDVGGANSKTLIHHTVLMESAQGYTGFDFIDVSMFASIRVMMFGRDASDETGTLFLYGVPDSGILERIGSLALVLGNVKSRDASVNPPGVLVDISTDKDIRDAFDDGNDWFACDTYTETDTAGVLTPVSQTDRPGWVDIDCNFGWNWIMPVVQFGTCAAMGGIFRGLTRRTDIIHTV